MFKYLHVITVIYFFVFIVVGFCEEKKQKSFTIVDLIAEKIGLSIQVIKTHLLNYPNQLLDQFSIFKQLGVTLFDLRGFTTHP